MNRFRCTEHQPGRGETSARPESVRLENLDSTFVTTGLPDAVGAAHERTEAASTDRGRDLDVVLMGGGATTGTPLFSGRTPRTLAQRTAVATPSVTHLFCDVT